MIKINKKGTIISIFSILLAVVVLSGAVSAADIDEAQINVENDVDESVIVCSDIIIIDEGTYSDLADEIGDGGNITLEKRVYTFSGGDEIKIRTPGVIDGNGACIYMADSNVRVFNILTDGVIIKNLNFFDVNNDDSGGAINFFYSGAVDNCNFINCKGYVGSAIYMESGIVENCNFFDNTAYGATVYVSEGTVRNCNFTGNTAFEGAAVGIYYGTVENCYFFDNTAERNGGAVWIVDGAVNNCNFDSNYAGQDGGAVFMYSGSIDDCNFNNNQAYNNGGAVCVEREASITNSNFKENDAFLGGAVWMKKGAVDTCGFENNTAGADAGAVYMQTGTVENSSFNGDKATIRGDAIFINENYVVKNCDFSNIDSENAIESDHDGVIEDCTFDEDVNSVEITDPVVILPYIIED